MKNGETSKTVIHAGDILSLITDLKIRIADCDIKAAEYRIKKVPQFIGLAKGQKRGYQQCIDKLNELIGAPTEWWDEPSADSQPDSHLTMTIYMVAIAMFLIGVFCGYLIFT